MQFILVRLYLCIPSTNPRVEKQQQFAKAQKATCKDVKYCFGVLGAQFGIVANPNKQWDHEVITNILMACVMLHAMIIRNE